MRAASGIDRADAEATEPPPRAAVPARGHASRAQPGRSAESGRSRAARSPPRCCSRPQSSGSRPTSSGCSPSSSSAATSSRCAPSGSASRARSSGSCWRWRCSGPAPAVAMGIACASVDAVRGRIRGSLLLNNLATYAFFPLLGGVVLHRLADDRIADEGGYALAVFAVFVGANVLNFVLIAGHTVYLRGGSLAELFRTVYMPVFPWELATASLTAMTIYALRGHYGDYGASAIGLFALALGICQLLLRSLLEGQAHGEEVIRRTDQLDIRHEGMVGLLLETLALRDPSRRPPRRGGRALRAPARQGGRPAAARAGDRAHGRPAARHRQGGAARPHPARPQRAARRRAAAGRAPSVRRGASCCCASRAWARWRRGARPPRADRRPRLPRRPRRRRHPDDRADPRDRRGLRRPDGAGLLQDPARRRPRPRTSCAGSPAASSTAGSCGCSSPRCCAASSFDHEGRIADLETELQLQRQMRGVLDQPLVLGPPTARARARTRSRCRRSRRAGSRAGAGGRSPRCCPTG